MLVENTLRVLIQWAHKLSRSLFSAGGAILPRRGCGAVSGDVFGCGNWGRGCVILAACGWGARDAAQHPALPRTVPTTKSDPAARIRSAEAAKP